MAREKEDQYNYIKFVFMANESGSSVIISQKEICEKYGAEFCESDLNLRVGISKEAMEGIMPLNGLRHPLEGNMTGWYIWAGEFSDAIDFFDPLCVHHIEEYCPSILKYLGLAPGWRFLIADNYEDVWEDESLLDI